MTKLNGVGFVTDLDCSIWMNIIYTFSKFHDATRQDGFFLFLIDAIWCMPFIACAQHNLKHPNPIMHNAVNI